MINERGCHILAHKISGIKSSLVLEVSRWEKGTEPRDSSLPEEIKVVRKTLEPNQALEVFIQ